MEQFLELILIIPATVIFMMIYILVNEDREKEDE